MPLRTTLLAAAALAMSPAAHADPETDRRQVAALDTAYQEAVERNDADGMAAILHDDMILILGVGTVVTRDDLLKSARDKAVAWERQVEDEGTQTVRLYGKDTAIVTARLWLKGTRKNGQSFDRRLWFSDTYVRTPQGWKYAFAQASMDLPKPAPG
jgi:ketosteroid isomerase-like protein